MSRREQRKWRVVRSVLGSKLFFFSVLLFQPSATAKEAWENVAPGIRSRALSSSSPTDSANKTRFASLPPECTGIDFVERLDWQHPQGQLFYTGFACGGLAVGDLDGNGLPDLFFASGPNRNRLYFQRTPWKFEEAAEQAGVASDEADENTWSTGATLFDIDNDGDLDLYICHYDAANQLFINRGEGTFDERAAEYGLDIVDASLMASIADYDRDGNLDIYLAVNRYLDEREFRRRDLFYWRDGMEYLRPAAEKYFTIRRFRDKAGQLNMWAGRTDRLLRNQGPGQKFVDVSQSMGLERGDTLSATWWDYDHDGWPDLYVANDMAAPDRLFRNLGDGTFEDVARNSLPHTPWFAMGSSAGDINNDGMIDFLVADMSFRTHFKDKVSMGDMTAKFRNVSVFPHNQLMRNALFVNTGTDHFQEAAYLAGLASTDWTWTAKLADFDNDGRLDAYFTNGSPVNLAKSGGLQSPGTGPGVIDTSGLRKRYGSQPPVLEQNLAFRNQGDLKFADHSQAWGLDQVGMSFGAIHADIDRDGDLDLVVANLDAAPSLYRNGSQGTGLTVELRGTKANRFGIGAEITLETTAGIQVRQNYPVAGFQSCQESSVHFGLGHAEAIQSLRVRWPSGVEQVFEDLPVGSHYQIDETEGKLTSQSETVTVQPLFSPRNGQVLAEHHEEPFDDFARQPLLPNKLSQLGPPLAWGDVDGDGDQDFYLGEGADWMGMIYLNQGKFQFSPHPQSDFARDEAAEDSAAVFFDANGDGHLDLYVGSGSVEGEPGSKVYRDRLYFGDGRGRFVRAAKSWLPDLRLSTGAIAANDFDRDGDVDLFVGMRSKPGEYPVAPKHALLRNEGDYFANVLELVAPELSAAGMVTDAAWTDVDGDGWDDLLVTTDWGPVQLYRNERGKLVEATAEAGLAQWSGWWQSLATSDVDNDGDIDFVAGNFGLNTKYKASAKQPVLAYFGEYGGSGRKNFIEASFEDDTLFPLRGKSCSSAAMPHLSQRFPTYEKFALATLPEIYTQECLRKAEKFSVNTLESAVFINDGDGHFERVPLPREAQIAPVFDLAIADFNEDGVPDVFLGQNFFSPQRETGPMDGGLSVIAFGRGDGSFRALRPDSSGVSIQRDVKAVAAIDMDGDGREDLCAATNDGPLMLYQARTDSPLAAKLVRHDEGTEWSSQNIALAKQFFATQQYEQGLPYLRRAQKVSPHDPQAIFMLAIVRREQGRFGDAKELLANLGTQDVFDQTTLAIEKARVYFDMKQFDRAEALLSTTATAAPRDQRVQRLLGEVRVAQGKLHLARDSFQWAGMHERLAELENRAEVARLAFEQAELAERIGETKDAIRLYEKSRKFDAQPEVLKTLASVLKTSQDEQLRDEWYAEQLLRWSEELRHEANTSGFE